MNISLHTKSGYGSAADMRGSRKKAVILLAAGQGKRLLSSLPKVLHPLAGKRVIDYPIALAKSLHPSWIIAVIPPGKNAIYTHLRTIYPDVKIAVQKHPKGTGHAVMQAAALLRRFHGDVLILYGDVPLLRRSSIEAFYDDYLRSGSKLAMMTTRLEDPSGYGRIVRNAGGIFEEIVEEQDADVFTKAIQEVNCGIYWGEADSLFSGLKELKADNAQKEYYLTDLPRLLLRRGEQVGTWLVKDPNEILGINTRQQLAEAHSVLFKRSAEHWLAQGVTLVDPKTSYIEPTVHLAKDCVVEPACYLRGHTSIGQGTHVGTGSVIDDCWIGEEVMIHPYSVLRESRIDAHAQVGPFAHLRPGSHLKPHSKIGNFVEMKKTIFGKNAKANHLSYLGDTVVHDDANIGAGTITCNYDGTSKWKTTIGKRAFIGSNSSLVAPIKIGQNAVVGAGSVITKNVPNNALAIAREKQIDIPNWKSGRPKKRK